MNDNNKWGPLEYLTLLGAARLVYGIGSWMIGSLVYTAYVLKWFILTFVIFSLYILGFLLWEITPLWVMLTFLIIICAILLLLRYNKHVNKEKHRVIEDAKKQVSADEQQAYADDIISIENYLAKLEFHYYDFEKRKFVEWLEDGGFVFLFKTWDEAFILMLIGKVNNKHYICDLEYMYPSQKEAKREAAWEKRKDVQRQAQLKINAEIKKARKEKRAS